MIKDEVRKFILEKFLFNCGDQLDDEMSLIDTNTVDSVGILEIVGFIENRFRIKVEDEELTAENLDSINKIAKFVERKLGTQG
ncbi:MAG: Acyl carrier protein [Candidatus Saccharicenans subterraneus]|uniref:Acyl carrier protein n=1 Tax=Candidatus Saccharicenans subterraneus TaxID=2508984 RepID=A0A3E2BLQ4_9BACT|nr:MAG: Acyl carrier protein [Candidatus Saccharicenans subterraneum]